MQVPDPKLVGIVSDYLWISKPNLVHFFGKIPSRWSSIKFATGLNIIIDKKDKSDQAALLPR